MIEDEFIIVLVLNIALLVAIIGLNLTTIIYKSIRRNKNEYSKKYDANVTNIKK